MPRPSRGLIVFALLLVAVAAVRGAYAASPPQASSGGPPGPPRIIVLPPQLIVGARATLAVLDSNGRLVPAVDIQFSGGGNLTGGSTILSSGNVTTDGTGRAAFVAPATTGIFTAHLVENGLTFTTTIVPPVLNAAGTETGNPPSFISPRVISLRDQFELRGTGFSGDADQNRVLLDNRPALVLAASPVSLVLLPNPRMAVGSATLVVTTGGAVGAAVLRSVPVRVTVVALEVTGPENALAAGEEGALTVRIIGSTERLTIEVRNFSPEIIELVTRDAPGAYVPGGTAPGSVTRLTTTGGQTNVARAPLIGVTPGDYSVSARLVGGMAGLSKVETARQDLLAARLVADAKWQKRIDASLQRIDRLSGPLSARESKHEFGGEDPGVVRVRREIEHLMRDGPSGRVAELLQAAWEALEAD